MNRREFLKLCGKTGLVLSGISSIGCLGDAESKPVEPADKLIIGKINSLYEQELVYVEGKRNTAIPITFLEVESDNGGNYSFILAGPHNIEEGDKLKILYLPDEDITGDEILDRYYSLMGGMGKLVYTPNVDFLVDGYVKAWKKI